MSTNTTKLPKHLAKLDKSVWSFFIKNFRVTLLLIIAILLLGVQSALMLPQEVNPEVRIPMATIMTPYPGANPMDVEKLVTDKVEAAIANIENIDTLTSTSQESVSIVIITFEASSDMAENMDNLRTALEKLQGLPTDVERPTAQEVSLSDTPIVTFSFSGNYSEEYLKEYGEIIEEAIRKVPGISDVIVSGIRDKEFQILIQKDMLAQYNITIGEVIQLLQSEQINAPVGTLTLDDTRFPIRISGNINTLEILRNLPLRKTETGFLYLKDVAHITEDFSKQTILSRFSSEGQPSVTSISLSLFKKSGGNTIQIIENAKKSIDTLYANGQISEHLHFDVTNDNSEFIREDLDTLINSGWQTVALISFILFLVLGFKTALVASISIPLVFCIAFIGLRMLGLTLNSMTLFSLVLSLGLLVDAAIIMMEGFYEAHIVKGKSPYEAALETIYTYRWPLLSGTATTVAVFIPMFLVSGIMGEFLRAIPWTIIITLSSSFFVAVCLCVSLSNVIFSIKKDKEHKPKEQHTGKVMMLLQKHYLAAMNYMLRRRFFRWLVVCMSVVLFTGSLALPVIGALPVEMFPGVNANYFSISIETAQGTALEKTDTIVRQIEEILQQDTTIKNYVVTVGSGAAGRDSVLSGPGGGSSHIAGISVNLIDKELRTESSSDIIQRLRTQFADITSARVSITEAQAGPSSGAPIEMRVTGTDLDTLSEIGTHIKQLLTEIPGTVEIETDIETGTGEFVLHLDREHMRLLGIRPTEVTSTLRTAAYGLTATTVQNNGEDQDIVVHYDWGTTYAPNELRSLEDLQNIQISTASGQPVPLHAIADISLGVSYTAIRHYNQDRVVRITGQTETISPLEVVTTLKEKLQTYELPRGYEIAYGGENEETEESFTELFSAMIIGILLMAIILVLQFNSFVQPFIILFSVPLSLIGVFPGLTVAGFALSFPAFIGVISLAGIVINDGIVLIDRINNNRATGMEFIDSISESTIARMQPIFITSITTIIGLLPLSLSDPVWGGLGFSIIFGLTASTVLILLVVPVLYAMMEGRSAKKKGEWKTA